jgi:hypothetical protein
MTVSFPLTQLDKGTVLKKISNARVSRAESGKVRQLKLANVELWEGTFVFGALTEAVMDSTMDWIQANEVTDDWAIVYGSYTYTGRIASDVAVEKWENAAILWQIKFTFVGVKTP